MQTFDVMFTVYLGEQPIRRWQMVAPQEFIIMKFLQTVQQIISQSQPMKVIVSRDEVIWDQFEQKQKIIPLYYGISELLRKGVSNNEVFY